MPYDSETYVEPKLAPHKKILIATKKNILKRGWCQGAAELPDGSMCIVGALTHAMTEAHASGTLITAARKELADQIYLEHNLDPRAYDDVRSDCGNHSAVVSWNDQPGRTEEQVLALIQRAIEA